jgi:hypothetical protein
VKPATQDLRGAVLFQFLRSRTQASFNMQSSWTYPEHFYKTRLLRDWPTLQWCCAINEDMGHFQGLMAGIDGVVTDHVESAEAPTTDAGTCVAFGP